MIKNMKWAKNLKIISSLWWALGLLLLAAVLLVSFFKLGYKPSPKVVLSPAEDLQINEPFSGTLFFNNQMGSEVFSKPLVEVIAKSKKTIEVAVYSMDDDRIRDAIYAASKRGVKVSIILSDKRKEGHDGVFKNMPAGMTRQDISSKDGSMHHKFIIIDRGTPEALLFFGSYNFTRLQEKFDPCFLLETTRPEIVQVFGKEFDRLNSGEHSISKKSNPFAARIKYPEGYLEIWFSPQREAGLRDRMIQMIKSADKEIKALVWNFTDDGLAQEFLAAAKKKKITIITDDANYNGPDSVFSVMQKEKIRRYLNNLTIITDAKRSREVEQEFKQKDFNSFLHHHVLLIDDREVAFGTGNWSKGGFYGNDESYMISDIPQLVKEFSTTWSFHYEKNK